LILTSRLNPALPKDVLFHASKPLTSVQKYFGVPLGAGSKLKLLFFRFFISNSSIFLKIVVYLFNPTEFPTHFEKPKLSAGAATFPANCQIPIIALVLR